MSEMKATPPTIKRACVSAVLRGATAARKVAVDDIDRSFISESFFNLK
jgi:hypothetical protein